jgi:predicted site-specific integrase-resolvase
MDFEEVCDYLQASPSTIRSYLAEGMTEAGFKVGKEWRFLPLDLIDWLKRRQQRQAARQRKAATPRRSTPRSGHARIDQFLEEHWPERG